MNRAQIAELIALPARRACPPAYARCCPHVLDGLRLEADIRLLPDAGDTEATLHAMATKILRYRQLGDSAAMPACETLVPLVCWDSLGP
jgi:hypothetical protein